MGHTVTYDGTSKVLYVFGGSKNKKWYNTMHTLDLHTWKWNQIEVRNGHGIVVCTCNLATCVMYE